MRPSLDVRPGLEEIGSDLLHTSKAGCLKTGGLSKKHVCSNNIWQIVEQCSYTAIFLPLPPFWSSLIISDKIFEWIFVFSFTFNIYLMDKLTISQSSLPIYLMTLMVTMPKHKQCFKHVRTSWTLASEQYIKYFRQWKYYVKYLYISNSVLTMMLAPDKKIFWGVFF